MPVSYKTKPSPHQAWGDIKVSSAHVGLSRWQFERLVRQQVFPEGVALTRNGKRLWKLAALDAAIEKAGRSRKPPREPRGIVKQRMEAADA